MRSNKLWIVAFSTVLFSAACEPPPEEEQETKEQIDDILPPGLSRADRAAQLSLRAVRGFVENGITPADLTTVRGVSIDAFGVTHARIAQTYNGIPVFGGEIIVHLAEDGSVQSFTNGLL